VSLSEKGVIGWTGIFLNRKTGKVSGRGITAHGKEKTTAKESYPKTNQNGLHQTFAFTAPDATSVQLVGDFTQ
jgi:hypothetical protein